MSDGRPSITTIRKASDRSPLSWGAASWSSDISKQNDIHIENGAIHGNRRSTGPTDGLQAWWKLTDGDSPSTLTDSVGGHHGDLHGASFVDTERGTAVHFDGNDYAYLEFPINQSFTVSIWAKSGHSTNWSHSGVLFSARNANGFIIHPQNNSKAWRGYVIDTTDNSYHRIADSHFISQITNWHQYTLTYDHDTGIGKTYFDGVQQAETSLSIPRQSSTISAHLGRDSPPHQDRYYVGYLSEARLYSRALPAVDVEALYAATQMP